MSISLGRSGSQRDREREHSVSLFDVVSMLIERRKLIVICLLAVLIPSLITLLLMPNQYLSTATILPSKQADSFQDLKAIAGIFGSQIPLGGTPELFPVVLRSRLVADAVLKYKYSLIWNNIDTCITLEDYFSQTNKDKLRALLAGITTISTDKKTGTISIGVETECPELSLGITQRYLAELEQYNLHSRTTKAQVMEQYLARESAAREEILLITQDKLREFQEANRNWAQTSNPLILQELARLKRDVAILEQNFIFLSREHESAKLEVELDTPIITILDQPFLPELKSGPFRLTILTAVGFLALTITLILVTILDSIQGRARESEKSSYERLRGNIHTAFPTASRLILRTQKSKTTPHHEDIGSPIG